jgi:hypothetical protein
MPASVPLPCAIAAIPTLETGPVFDFMLYTVIARELNCGRRSLVAPRRCASPEVGSPYYRTPTLS